MTSYVAIVPTRESAVYDSWGVEILAPATNERVEWIHLGDFPANEPHEGGWYDRQAWATLYKAKYARLNAAARKAGWLVNWNRPSASTDTTRYPARRISAAPASQPGTSQPDTSRPDTSRPDTSRPDTSRPDTSHSDTSHSDT